MKNYHTIKDWDKPRSGDFKILCDYYWVVDRDGNPLFWGKDHSPQCNLNQQICKNHPTGNAVLQIPVVYIPLNH